MNLSRVARLLRGWHRATLASLAVTALVLSSTAANAGDGTPHARRAVAASPDTITISFQTPDLQAYQFQGFGVSLAWWANVVGGWSPAQRSQIEDALFGTADLINPNRLGLNVLRYNIGATPVLGNPPQPDLTMLPSFCRTWNIPGAAVPAVQSGPGQPIDLAQDTNQIRVLTEAVSRLRAAGQQPVLEAFANSAPWWMTRSKCPQGSGALIAGVPVELQDNLEQGQYGNYAQYLTDVLQALRDQDGITFGSIEPLNEPDDPWVPGLNGGQEGMRLSRQLTVPVIAPPKPQDSVLSALCADLKDAQLDTAVAAPDGFNPDGASSFPVAPPDNTLADLNSYSQGTLDCLDQLNTHMYDLGISFSLGWQPAKVNLGTYVGTGRRAVADAANTLSPNQIPKRAWMSEYGRGGGAADITAGTGLAKEIARDIRYLRASAWVYWQAVEADGGWGLINATPGPQSSAPIKYPAEAALAPNFPNEIHPCHLPQPCFVTPTKRFFALEQYSRFIHPGAFIVSSHDSDPAADNTSAETASTVAALDENAHTLTIVTTNDTNSPRTPTYDISALESSLPTSNVQVYRTDSDHNVQPDTPLQLANGQFTDTQQAHSINTYIIGLPGLPSTGFPPNQPPVVSAGGDVTGNETTTIPLHGSATDPDGDRLRIRWSAAPATRTTDPGASCRFADPASPQTTVTCSDEGDYRITLTADDGVNLPVSSSATAHVTNLGPAISVTAPTPWQIFQAPATIHLAAPVTDPGAHDTHTCRINWDDGTPPDTFAQEGSCDRAHTYTHPGMFTITATVTDDDHNSATASVIAIVVDPRAGSVLGAGRIDSPPGAYVPDPTLTGDAHFVFTARYPHGATTPRGNLLFLIPRAHVLLHGDDLQWLVVSPDGELAIKGAGTLRQQHTRHDVNFVIYGYHGCERRQTTGCQPGPDRFRAVIWPASAGPIPASTLIYDNSPGSDFELTDANPQTIEAGTIQIHHELR